MTEFSTSLLRTILLTEYRWTPIQVADLLRTLRARSGTKVVQPREAAPAPQPARLPDSPRKVQRKRS